MKKYMIMDKKGFVFVLVMVFLIVVTIASVGVYNSVYFVNKTQGIDEIGRIRGYYVASAGLSYASVILKDPVACPITKHIKMDYPQLWNNLGLTGSEDVEIKITDHAGGGYDVISTFTSFTQDIKIAGFVPKFGFPKTGQAISYLVNDDGYYGRGMPVSGPHYQDNLDGTVTDNATGLMWVQDPSLCGGSSYPNLWANGPNIPAPQPWNDAIANCEALDYAGHNDWRLPNIKELLSIVDYGRLKPAIDTSVFKYAPSGSSDYYWSSTSCAYSPGGSFWYVFFWSGEAQSAGISDYCYVRPVRGGQ